MLYEPRGCVGLSGFFGTKNFGENQKSVREGFKSANKPVQSITSMLERESNSGARVCGRAVGPSMD